ncbi:response regulator [Burkholderia gladioli]|nr:response regulator [Burkholderia gladioli]
MQRVFEKWAQGNDNPALPALPAFRRSSSAERTHWNASYRSPNHFGRDVPYALRNASRGNRLHHTLATRSSAVFSSSHYKDSAEATAVFFSLNGFDTQFALSGGSAADLLQDWTPSIALIDILMPDMDGFTVARFPREQRETQAALLTAFTSMDEWAVRNEGVSSGLDGYYQKGGSLTGLIDMLREAERNSIDSCSKELLRVTTYLEHYNQAYRRHPPGKLGTKQLCSPTCARILRTVCKRGQLCASTLKRPISSLR